MGGAFGGPAIAFDNVRNVCARLDVDIALFKIVWREAVAVLNVRQQRFKGQVLDIRKHGRFLCMGWY